MTWDPEQYHKFKAERAAPFNDLTALVRIRPGLRVIDLGCGTGELTRRLAVMLPDSDVVGIDNSPQMLAQAAQYERPGVRFEQRAIEDTAGEWDLVFSHVALQRLDDHHTFIPRLLALVRPGGQLVVQMPSNHDHYSHRAARELAREAPFDAALNGWSRASPVLPVDEYAELLYDGGGRDLVVFEKVYPHVLENADAIAEWVSGTLLIPYMERLPESLRQPYMDAYRARLRQHWTASPVFYGFRRTLFAATHAYTHSA